MSSAASGGWAGQPSRAGDRAVGQSTFGSVAALGVGAVGLTVALAAAAWAGLLRQARTAAAVIEAAAIQATLADGTLPSGAALASQAVPPRADGRYLPDGTGPVAPSRPTAGASVRGALRLAMVGDSTSVGYGCATADQVPGVVLARGAAAALDRPVELRSIGVVGSGAADLAAQVDLLLADPVEVAVIVTGANDITARIPPWQSAAQLGAAVGRLHAAGIPVVVGTCPDLGVIAPIPQPLRSLVGTWSRRLAAMQARAATGAGGRVVMIGRLVSPEFRGRPELFYADGFHPSGPGYAKAAAALLPDVVAALDSPVDQARGADQPRTPSASARSETSPRS